MSRNEPDWDKTLMSWVGAVVLASPLIWIVLANNIPKKPALHQEKTKLQHVERSNFEAENIQLRESIRQLESKQQKLETESTKNENPNVSIVKLAVAMSGITMVGGVLIFIFARKSLFGGSTA